MAFGVQTGTQLLLFFVHLLQLELILDSQLEARLDHLQLLLHELKLLAFEFELLVCRGLVGLGACHFLVFILL